MAEKEVRLIDANAIDFGFPMSDDLNGMLRQIGIEMAKTRVDNANTLGGWPDLYCYDAAGFSRLGTKGGTKMHKELVKQLRSTVSRSKRTLFDDATVLCWAPTLYWEG